MATKKATNRRRKAKRKPLPAAPKKKTRLGKQNKKFGHPVEEAKEGISFPLLDQDIELAEEAFTGNNQDNFPVCVIAQATNRVLGDDAQVHIGAEVAYVEFPKAKVTRRYLLDQKSKEIVKAWDRGDDVEEGVEIRLMAPRPSHTRRELADKNRGYRKKNPDYKPSGRKTKRKNPQSGVREGKTESETRNMKHIKWS